MTETNTQRTEPVCESCRHHEKALRERIASSGFAKITLRCKECGSLWLADKRSGEVAIIDESQRLDPRKAFTQDNRRSRPL